MREEWWSHPSILARGGYYRLGEEWLMALLLFLFFYLDLNF
jgi:hypothetical protein